MKVWLKDNATLFSRPFINLFGFTIRMHGKRISNNPHPQFESVKQLFKVGFSVHGFKSGCRPLFWILKLK